MKSFLNKSLVAQLLALFAVSTLVVWGTLASDKQLNKIMPEAKTFASINNLKPSGLSAFYQLCRRAFPGRKVKEWDYAYRLLQGSTRRSDALPTDQPTTAAKGVLVIVSPEESLAPFEVEEILDWVKQGNALLYLDNFQFHYNKRLLDKIKVDARELEEPLTDRLSDSRLDHPLYTHLRTLKLSSQQKLSGGNSLAAVGDKILILEKSFGDGKILVGACPQMVSNRQITSSDRWSNFQFLHNWLATTNGDIYFDERCHGTSKGTNVVFYFLRGPAGLVLLQTLLILAIAVASAHQRFGAILATRNARRISNLEHINGLSNTYYRAGARQAVLSIIWSSVRQKLCKVLQISPHEEDGKLNQTLIAQQRLTGSYNADTTGKESKEVNMLTLVEQCENAVNRKDLNDDDLRELVAACDKIAEQADSLLTTTR
ncbi:MAG: DUF4350 domain-containing protein [Cyanobacteria bacterium REEB67]|nr:DUF4350 domain-containing protein [Cyanobacteria bacterium REEB67]